MAWATACARRMVRTGVVLAGAIAVLAACAPSPFFTGTGTATAPGAVPRDANGEPILKGEGKPDGQ